MITGNTLIRTVKGTIPVEDLQEGDEVYSSIIDPWATSKIKSIEKVYVDSIAVLKLKFGEFLEFHESSKILIGKEDGNYRFLSFDKVPDYVVVAYDNNTPEFEHSHFGAPNFDKYSIRYCHNNNLLFQETVYNIKLDNNTENTFLHIKFKNSNITLFIKN